MQKISTCLWFDNQGMKAAKLYTSLFKDSRIETINHTFTEDGQLDLENALVIRFFLAGREFYIVNGGPEFKMNPSISLVVSCETQQDFDRIWDTLADQGMVLMEKGKYPFAESYGWLSDKYGISWQLMLTGEKEKITPSLMFFGDNYKKAELAAGFYCSLFDNSSINPIIKNEDESAATLKFTLEGVEFLASDSDYSHNFSFNEGVSFYVYCKDQQELDQLWRKFVNDGGEDSYCGWIKDKFGVSWQLVPEEYEKWVDEGDPDRAFRVTNAMLKMRKLDISILEKAYYNN